MPDFVNQHLANRTSKTTWSFVSGFVQSCRFIDGRFGRHSQTKAFGLPDGWSGRAGQPRVRQKPSQTSEFEICSIVTVQGKNISKILHSEGITFTLTQVSSPEKAQLRKKMSFPVVLKWTPRFLTANHCQLRLCGFLAHTHCHKLDHSTVFLFTATEQASVEALAVAGVYVAVGRLSWQRKCQGKEHQADGAARGSEGKHPASRQTLPIHRPQECQSGKEDFCCGLFFSGLFCTESVERTCKRDFSSCCVLPLLPIDCRFAIHCQKRQIPMSPGCQFTPFPPSRTTVSILSVIWQLIRGVFSCREYLTCSFLLLRA